MFLNPILKRLILGFSLVILFLPLFSQEERVYKSPLYEDDWSLPGKYPDHIVLNFGEDPATQVAVTWRTDTSIQEGYVEYGIATAAPRFWRNAKTVKAKTEVMDASKVETAEVVSHYHSLLMDDLKPDTIYAYRVGDGDRWSEWIQFRTASKTDKPFSFLYVGDAQNYIMELWSRLIREGYRKAPYANFIIHAGDLVTDAHDEGQWHEWFTAGGWIHSMLPSVPALGNHEYEPYSEEEDKKGIDHVSIQWRPQFNLPKNGPEGMEEYVYYIDYQDMRLIVLNTRGIEMEAQVPWLESVLKDNPKKWTVVTYHHPMFSASKRRDNKGVRVLWKPLFDKYGVDLALQGHDHSYARGRVAPDGTNIVDGVNKLDETGTVYVVSVSGGKMYEIKESWDEYEAVRDRAAENTQLVQLIKIDGDNLIYESYTATGELYDKFSLTKQGDGKPNKFIEMKDEAIPPRRHNNTVKY